MTLRVEESAIDVHSDNGGAQASSHAASSTGQNDAPAHQRPEPERFYDIVEPAAALKALEEELESMVAQCIADGVPQDQRIICDALCRLIKRECDAEVRSLAIWFCTCSLYVLSEGKRARNLTRVCSSTRARWLCIAS